MRPTLFVKYLDLVIQVCTTIFVSLYMHNNGGLLAGWVALGAAQTLSCIINLCALSSQFRAASRRAYEIIIGVFVLLAILIFVFKFDHGYSPLTIALGKALYLIIIISPGLAIWYFTITIAEMLKIKDDENDTIS